MSMRLSTGRVIRPSSHALDSCNQLTNQSYLLRRIMCWSPTGKSESSGDLISFKVVLILDIALIVQSKVRYYNHHHHPHLHCHLTNNELQDHMKQSDSYHIVRIRSDSTAPNPTLLFSDRSQAYSFFCVERALGRNRLKKITHVKIY